VIAISHTIAVGRSCFNSSCEFEHPCPSEQWLGVGDYKGAAGTTDTWTVTRDMATQAVVSFTSWCY